MKTRLSLLERELGIYEDNYSFIEDNKGNVVEIVIYDNDYCEITVDGDKLIDILCTYKYLKSIEVSISDCVINDISKLSNIKELEFFHLECVTNISNISVFENLSNIKSICIPDAKISDLFSLKNCYKLETLILYNNKIKNIDCIENLKQLQNLNISWNEVEDVSVLKNLKNLKVLGLRNNQLKDLSVLKSLTDIQSIDISSNKISSLDFLDGKENLKSFYFDNNLINTCEVISNHKELVYLSFENNQISNVSALSDLKKLNTLLLSNNPIFDFSSVYSLESLHFLKANNIKINDFNGFENLTELRYLFLNNSNVKEVSFLEKNVKIVNLSLNDNDICSVFPLSDLSNLKSLSLRNNEIKDVFPLHIFYDLDELDLRGNVFGNCLYVKYIGYNNVTTENPDQLSTFDELVKNIGEYYLTKKESDKALAFCYLEWPVKNQLIIYSEKFIQTENENIYYLKYYFSKCSQAINSILNKKEEQIEDLIDNIKVKINSLNIRDKDDFMYCLENSRGYPYAVFEDFYEYYSTNVSESKNPEVLYFLAKNLSKRESLIQALSIYKELKKDNNPLIFRLHSNIRHCLKMQFAYTENEREEYDKFRGFLDGIEEAQIPYFDYMNYISINYKKSRYSYSVIPENNIYKEDLERSEMSFTERFQILFTLSIVFGCVLGLLYIVYLILTFP